MDKIKNTNKTESCKDVQNVSPVKKKRSFGAYLLKLYKYNEFTMSVMGLILVLVTTVIFLMSDRYSLAQERIAILEMENMELYSMLVSDTLTTECSDEAKSRLNAYKEMLLKKYK